MADLQRKVSSLEHVLTSHLFISPVVRPQIYLGVAKSWALQLRLLPSVDEGVAPAATQGARQLIESNRLSCFPSASPFFNP